MPKINVPEVKGCSTCSKSGESVPLLECLACLRDGKEHDHQAYCQGACFHRHWRSHRDRKLEGSASSSAKLDASIDNKYAAPVLRASSQPFLPAKSPIQQRQRLPPVASRMLTLPNGIVQSSMAYLPYGQPNAQPILATGPHFQRR